MEKIEKTGVDYAAMAEGLDELREALRSMKAGIMAEGFSEEQACDIIAGIWRSFHRKGESDDNG